MPCMSLDARGSLRTKQGAKADRPVLKEALGHLCAANTLVVWRFDRLGRLLKDLILRAEELHACLLYTSDAADD